MSKGRHRINKSPKKSVYRQWEHEPMYPDAPDPNDRLGFWQRAAAKTNGVLAPAMPVTAAGNAAAAIGIVEACNGRPLAGAAWFVGGRIGDFLDGKIARLTKTASSMGEAFDVGFDKLQAIAGMGALWLYGLYPTEAMVPKTATQLAITAAGAMAIKAGVELHPGKAGKINMGATTASMASFIAADAIPATQQLVSDILPVTQETLHNSLEYGGGYGLTGVSILAGGSAIYGYFKDVREGRRTQAEPVIANDQAYGYGQRQRNYSLADIRSFGEDPTQPIMLVDECSTKPIQQQQNHEY